MQMSSAYAEPDVLSCLTRRQNEGWQRGIRKIPFHEIVLLNVFPIYSIIFCDIIPRFDRKSLLPIQIGNETKTR